MATDAIVVRVPGLYVVSDADRVVVTERAHRRRDDWPVILAGFRDLRPVPDDLDLPELVRLYLDLRRAA